MCFQCHTNLDDIAVKEQLETEIREKQFKRWNTTSFSHCLLAVMGLNGHDVHDTALTLVEMFYIWYNGVTCGAWEYVMTYNPSRGLEPFPRVADMRKQIDSAIQFYQSHKHLNRDELIARLTGS